MGSATNHYVLDLFADSVNDVVYASGYFTSPGNRIAKWDGANWSNIGSGMNEDVLSLAIYNNELYAGGLFEIAGGNIIDGIAKWNGSSWSSLNSGIGGAITRVDGMIVYQGELYVGGDF